MKSDGAKFKIEWLPRKEDEQYLLIRNIGKTEAIDVHIVIDDGEGNFPHHESIHCFQPENEHYIPFPSPEGFQYDMYWQIEVKVTYEDCLGRRQLCFSVSPKRNRR